MRGEPTLAIVLAGFAAFLGLYATQPLLPLLTRTFQASAFSVGLTITAPTVVIALCAPFIGRLADTVGLRRVIVGSSFTLAVVTALAATSTTLRQLVMWRLAQGLMTPGIFAGTIAYIHEEWPAERSGRGTAAYMSGTILGGFTGRATAGLVAADVNWHMSFVVLAVLTFLIAAALFVLLPEERRSHSGEDGGGRRPGLLEHLQNIQLVTTYAIGFCILFTQVAMFTYVTFYLAAPPFRLSTAALGGLFVVYLLGATVTPFGGRWIDRYGQRSGLALAMGIAGAGALLTLIGWLPAIVAGLALCSTGVFIAQASTSSYIGAVTTRDRALAVGLYSTFYYTGGSVGAAAPAVLWSIGGWPACVALVFLVQMSGMVIALTFWKGRSDSVINAQVSNLNSPSL
jgi:MFS transporter, YNFM family, putative membrane transport protein